MIKVRHWDVDADHPFLVMDYIDGATLERLIRYHSHLDWQVAAALVADVADGLDHVHNLGIVHRDLKPANLLVAKTGRGCLADLGLARQMDGGADESWRSPFNRARNRHGLASLHGARAEWPTPQRLALRQISGAWEQPCTMPWWTPAVCRGHANPGAAHGDAR